MSEKRKIYCNVYYSNDKGFDVFKCGKSYDEKVDAIKNILSDDDLDLTEFTKEDTVYVKTIMVEVRMGERKE